MVTKATKQDINQIVDLVNSDPKHLLPRTYEEVEELLETFLVIKDGEKVIACGVFEDYAPKIGEIRSLVVHPDYRGRGYSVMLINELVKLAHPKQQVFVVTSKPDFFKKQGFDTFHEEKQVLFYQK